MPALQNTINYTWDNLGEMLTAADDFSSYTFSFNALGQQTSVDNGGTPDVPNVLLTSAFDVLGNRSTFDATIDPTGSDTADFQNSYDTDAFGRIGTIKQTSAEGGDYVADKRVDLTYNADGEFATINRYADLTATTLVAKSVYSYDTLGDLTGLTQGTTSTADAFAGYGWSFNADREVASFTNSAYASTEDIGTYGYDHDGQLTSVTPASGTASSAATTLANSYDPNGNPNAVEGEVGTDNQLTDDGTYTYSYATSGDLTRLTLDADGSYTSFSYDVRHRLATVATYVMSGETAVQTGETDYTYDMFNNVIVRTVKTFTDGSETGSAAEHYVYDGTIIVLAFDGSENLTDRYLWARARIKS